MNKHKKRFVKRGIVIPGIIALLMTISFFVIYGIVVDSFGFKEREFRVADYVPAEVQTIERLADINVVRKSELEPVDDNTVIGNASFKGVDMPIIFNGNEINSLGRLNIDGSRLIGERGSAYLYCSKRDALAVRSLSKGDTVQIETYYGSFEYKTVLTASVGADTELDSVAAEYAKALVLYTDSSEGVGIGDGYYAVVCQLVSGTEIKE